MEVKQQDAGPLKDIDELQSESMSESNGEDHQVTHTEPTPGPTRKREGHDKIPAKSVSLFKEDIFNHKVVSNIQSRKHSFKISNVQRPRHHLETRTITTTTNTQNHRNNGPKEELKRRDNSLESPPRKLIKHRSNMRKSSSSKRINPSLKHQY